MARPSQAELSSLRATAPPPPLIKREPVNYSRELADVVCERVSGGESLEQLTMQPGMPSKSSVMRWLNNDVDGFAARYSRAREGLCEHWAEQIVTIADDQTLEPNARRIMIEARLRILAKLAPRRYGDKVQISGDPDNPIQVVHRQVAIEDLSVVELEAIELLQLARLNATNLVETGAGWGQDDEDPQKA